MSLENDRQEALAALRVERGPAAVVEALQKASVLIEHAAYEAAQLEGSTTIAELILTAARLERIAKQIAEQSLLEDPR